MCATKLHISHEQCVRRHCFSMTTKSPTLNISDFVPSSVRGFEKTGETRFPCVFVALISCPHTLTCIMRALHLHVSTDRCMSKVRSLVLHAPCNHGENLSENPSSCTYLTPLPDLRIPGVPLPVPGPLSVLAMSEAMSLRRSRVTPEAATLASLSVRLTAND